MAAAAEAGSDWTVQKTKEGRLFYWNKATNKSVWEKPDGFEPEKQPATDKKDDWDDDPDVTPRVRKYLAGQGDEWIVYFRPKCKPLNAMRISADLWKHYPGVTNVTKLNQNKLRVVVNNPKEANDIVCDPRFCVEYRAWIPARSVEIDGVVSEEGLTAKQILNGVGQFKRRNLPTVQIIEVRRMATSEGEGANKRFIPSSSYRVTFAGTALPDFLLIDQVLRLPVRMFHPKVMSCSNCRKLGHTKSFCYNKKVCGKCGQKHQDEQCQAVENKCLLCGGAPHETRSCPKYRERSDKLVLELKRRSKRSFAEIVKSAAATTRNENRYAVLSDEEPEQESSGVELTFRPGGGDRKKKEKSRNQLDKTGKVLKDTSLLADKEDFNQAFPPVGSTRKHQEMAKVKVPFPQKEAIKSAGMRIPFSSIVELVLSTMSGPTRAMVEPLVPFFRAIGKQFAENSILLEFISFDS